MAEWSFRYRRYFLGKASNHSIVTPPVILLPDPERNRLGFLLLFFLPFFLFRKRKKFNVRHFHLDIHLYCQQSLWDWRPSCWSRRCISLQKVGQAHIEPTGLKLLLQWDCPSIERIMIARNCSHRNWHVVHSPVTSTHADSRTIGTIPTHTAHTP